MASCKPARSAFPPTDSHWLSPHRSRFLESLAAQGLCRTHRQELPAHGRPPVRGGGGPGPRALHA